MQASIRPVPEQISKIRENYPHSIALSYGNRSLNYEEFDRSADRFAGYLMQLGLAPGGTVAICMERSFDWIIAALGIMRAGAAYVPVDSAWPDSRLRFAVEDSGATFLVARAAVLDRLSGVARGIDPCRDGAAIAATPTAAHTPIEPESLAYVIYTSGSTGVPKGVEITHANLAHLTEWHQDAFGVTHQDRASHLAGLGFDAAAWELWPNLAAGATMCLANDIVRSSPESLRQWMIEERVTIGFVPTVHAAPMMAMAWPASTTLRLLLTGGDVLHHAPAVRLPFNVVNNYGPTECTVVATSGVVKPGSHGRPTIGCPVTGASVYLLDEYGGQVPDGSSGEIYIGGNGVARGYRNLPDSTQRSFLPDPFSGAPAARMYRTGDLGIRRPDGEIEFHGRLDRQTKIRGQRVELDEIASVLAHHSSIDFATAIAKCEKRAENRIVAYVLRKENAPVPTTLELQKHLGRSLPDYMIPSIFVRLQELPLSPNGKLDLTMLPEPTDTNLLERTAARTPATAIEEELLSIVQQLLENSAVGVEDNLFLAGGHSLLGMQLLMRLRSAFGVNLTVQQLFESPTVERLALLVEAKLADERITVPQQAQLGCGRLTLEPSPQASALESPRTRNAIFWVHYLGGNLAKAMGDDQPLFNVALAWEDLESLRDAPSLENIAACLVRKILAMRPTGPYIIGGYCLGGIVAYEVASQMRAVGCEVPLLFLVDTPADPLFYQSPRWNDEQPLPRIKRVMQLVKRVAQLGPRESLVKVRLRLLERFKPKEKTRLEIIQETVVAAASRYQPKKYHGKVVLLLASDHVHDFLSEWQTLGLCNLETHYLNGRHLDLVGPNVHDLANAMVSHLMSITDQKSLSSCLDGPQCIGKDQVDYHGSLFG
jgi:amino acid adenylation domain-containing protein